MKTNTLRTLIASSLISVTAVFGFCARAGENTAAAKSAPQLAAEQKADLVLWQRSGAAALFDASSLIAQYQSAHERYSQWRNGPEFGVELQKLGFTKTLLRTD